MVKTQLALLVAVENPAGRHPPPLGSLCWNWAQPGFKVRYTVQLWVECLLKCIHNSGDPIKALGQGPCIYHIQWSLRSPTPPPKAKAERAPTSLAAARANSESGGGNAGAEPNSDPEAGAGAGSRLLLNMGGGRGGIGPAPPPPLAGALTLDPWIGASQTSLLPDSHHVWALGAERPALPRRGCSATPTPQWWHRLTAPPPSSPPPRTTTPGWEAAQGAAGAAGPPEGWRAVLEAEAGGQGGGERRGRLPGRQGGRGEAEPTLGEGSPVAEPKRMGLSGRGEEQPETYYSGGAFSQKQITLKWRGNQFVSNSFVDLK